MATLLPLTPLGGESNRKKKAKVVGWNKGSLTEQQTKGTVTTILIKKNIQKKTPTKGICRATLSHCLMPSALPKRFTSPWPAPLLRTKHDAT